MDENIKSISCFDIWVIAAILFFAVGNIPNPTYNAKNNVEIIAESATFVFGAMYLIGVIVFLIFCSRLKKYRYLLVYNNCTKVIPTLKNILIILLVVAGILMLYTQFNLVISTIIYTSVAVLLGYKHIDSEDKI